MPPHKSPGQAGQDDGPVFCVGPGDPYEEDCLGNGRVHSPNGMPWTRCAKCRVERRRRNMAKRSRTQPTRRTRRRGRKERTERPKSLEEALREADLVFAQHDRKARDEHPEVHWQTHRKTTNEGRKVEYQSIDLRYSIRRS